MIYAISLNDGSYKRYNCNTDAAKDLKINLTSICQVISGKSTSTCDYTFVKANDVETIDNEAGIELNSRKLKKIAIKRDVHSIIIFKTDGTYKKYKNSKLTALDTGYSREYISMIANKKTKQFKNFFVVKANEILSVDSNNEIAIDIKKLYKALKKANLDTTIADNYKKRLHDAKIEANRAKKGKPQKQPKEPKQKILKDKNKEFVNTNEKPDFYYRKIYAYSYCKGDFVFKNVPDAAQRLNMSEEELIRCIKQNFPNKDGIVFGTDLDK